MANIQFQLRRGTDSEWTSANPVLANGEPGFDRTQNLLKIGDGITSWTSLAYLGHSALGGFPISISGLSDGDVLVFDQVGGSWVNKSQSDLIDGGVY